ncbi:MAG: tRNA (cytidine(34)-2'-O)-methyltransferase [Myxococcales bacterium]|nr:tRNA (cytidine(34)-2'-O)-methyltransferase [Myxococcales bacterium]
METPERLRARPQQAPFHVVLVEPEIPPNTGNIARLCGATCAPLHLVGKLGFRIDEHAVRRAGLDYWHLVEIHTHDTLPAAESFIHESAGNRQPRTWLFSGKARRSYLEVELSLGDILVFGKESVGLPQALLDQREAEVIGIPTLGAVRSLNLANSVSIALFEGLRRNGALEVQRGAWGA